MKPIRRVLHATDFSPASRRAFDTALSLAKSLEAPLTIVYVLAPITVVPEQYIDVNTMERLDRQAREWGMRQLNRLAARAKTAGVDATALFRDGDPAEQIVRACRSTRSGLIVVGTHGRRGLRRFLLGSVAERVVRTTTCSVLTVRPDGFRFELP